MNDILNLFKRDAEHEYRHGDDVVEGGGMNQRGGGLLGGGGRMMGERDLAESVGGDVHGVMRMAGRMVTPPGMGRGGGGQVRRDEGIYGRKW